MNSPGLSRYIFLKPSWEAKEKTAEKSSPFRRMALTVGGVCLGPDDGALFCGCCEVDWHRTNTRTCMRLGPEAWRPRREDWRGKRSCWQARRPDGRPRRVGFAAAAVVVAGRARIDCKVREAMVANFD